MSIPARRTPSDDPQQKVRALDKHGTLEGLRFYYIYHRTIPMPYHRITPENAPNILTPNIHQAAIKSFRLTGLSHVWCHEWEGGTQYITQFDDVESTGHHPTLHTFAVLWVDKIIAGPQWRHIYIFDTLGGYGFRSFVPLPIYDELTQIARAVQLKISRYVPSRYLEEVKYLTPHLVSAIVSKFSRWEGEKQGLFREWRKIVRGADHAAPSPWYDIKEVLTRSQEIFDQE